MKKNILLMAALLGTASLTLTSCDTAIGTGAGWGAATGAILGAAATGDVRGAAVGAVVGANTGALIGASIDEAEAVRYGPRPRGGFPYARRTDTPGFYQSHIRRTKSTTCAAFRMADSWKTASAAGIFGSRKRR